MIYEYNSGQTPLDEDEKLDLIPLAINRGELDAYEEQNIIEARQWLMNKRTLSREDIFTENFLKKLHKKMLGQVWKWAGEYRKSNKNIGDDRYQIATNLRQLLDDAHYWLEKKTYPIHEIAIIFHHRLVKIHLFPNGNGRHARLCADAIIAKYNLAPLVWGGHEICDENKTRKLYINALREADKGNYKPIIDFAVNS